MAPPYFFVPAWSLTIEEYFYLLFPLLLFFFMNIRRIPFRRSFLLMIILFFAIPFILRTAAFVLLDSGYIQQSRPGFNLHWDLHLRRITLFRLDAIAMGVLTAYLMNNYKSFYKNTNKPYSWLPLRCLQHLYGCISSLFIPTRSIL
ncbi:hypothetical protein [Paraflavitalea speifideaquila]|uniref:hypothetical protein n=1 Tax=Paraflavitalea speifideaquila TaxID=3076558 RepID=UPI0028E60C93|nr:hypothetical protein [Paraflavitalea speifideiaquila]